MKNRDAARQRQRDARRDLTDHARSLAFGAEDSGSEAGATRAVGDQDAMHRSALTRRSWRSSTRARHPHRPGSMSRKWGGNRTRAVPAAQALELGARQVVYESVARYQSQFMLRVDGGRAWPRARVVRHAPSQGAARAGNIFEGVHGVKAPERAVVRFPSALPGGSQRTKHGKAEDSFCILDCVFHQEDGVYYVMDCMAWNGMSMYDCTAEMRLSWLYSKLGDPETAECEAATGTGPNNRYRFAVPPTHNCDASGLRAAYGSPVPFRRDGIQFLAKDGNYELGVTPLAVMWKDPNTSDFFLDENPDGSDTQRVVLSLQSATGDVVTGDPTPIALARLPAQFWSRRAGRRDAPAGGDSIGRGQAWRGNGDCGTAFCCGSRWARAGCRSRTGCRWRPTSCTRA